MTTVSPYWIRMAPAACFAISPVVRLSLRPPNSRSTVTFTGIDLIKCVPGNGLLPAGENRRKAVCRKLVTNRQRALFAERELADQADVSVLLVAAEIVEQPA